MAFLSMSDSNSEQNDGIVVGRRIKIDVLTAHVSLVPFLS
jgi:hypothetical protein